MKLDYKIIWIDDRIEERPFAAIRADIKKYLEEDQFFKLTIAICDEMVDFKAKLKLDDFDLIITDYHLNNGELGSEVVSFVRTENKINTEILFYSAKQDLQPSEDLINNNRVTFFRLSDANAYRELGIEIKDLIGLTIKKFQSIVAMRGMIMQETSGLDQQTIDILSSYINGNPCEFISVPIFEKLLAQLNSKLKDVTNMIGSQNLKKLIKDNFLFSSDYKIDALSELLKFLKETDFSADYKTEIITRRNKFAHAVLMKDEKTGREFFKSGEDGITFDENSCKEIRRDIIKHKVNLDTLSKTLLAIKK